MFIEYFEVVETDLEDLEVVIITVSSHWNSSTDLDEKGNCTVGTGMEFKFPTVHVNNIYYFSKSYLAASFAIYSAVPHSETVHAICATLPSRYHS